MFLHPEYRFCPSNGPIDTSPVEKDRWWKDFNQQQQHLSPPPILPLEVPVDANSTMKAIRDFIRQNNLGIRTTGSGRSKKSVLKDIHHLIEGRNFFMDPPSNSNSNSNLSRRVDAAHDDQKELELDLKKRLRMQAMLETDSRKLTHHTKHFFDQLNQQKNETSQVFVY